jgi:hypothetical protein
MYAGRPFLRQTGLQNLLTINFMSEGRFGVCEQVCEDGFFHETKVSQPIERDFLYKKSSQELGDRISFCIMWIKNFN